MPPFFRRHWVSLTLLLILLTAGWMRLNGRNWDSGTDWHPDERHVVFDGTMANLNWPTGTTLTDLLDAWHSPINPRMNHNAPGTPAAWVYGTLPVYIVKLATWGAMTVVDTVNNAVGAYMPGTRVFATGKQITIPGGQIIPQWDGKIPAGNYFLDAAGIFQSGRTMANLFDLFTVFLVFLIGRRLYGPQAGLLAAAFSAFAVTQIQISNFYIVEPFLVTFMTAMLYFSVVLMQRPGFWPALGAGLCLGFALACKVSVVPLGLVIVAALVLRAVYRGRTRRLGPDPDVADPVGLRPGTRAEREQNFGRALLGLLPLLLVAMVATILAFFIGDPYAFLQWNHPPVFDFSRLLSRDLTGFFEATGNEYLHQLAIEAGNQSGSADVPFTRQFIGTIPGVYHLQQVVQWGMGPASGLVALAALFWGLWRAVRGRAAEILLLSASLTYFATIATLEAKWPRYMLPIVPYLCVLAGGLLVAGLAWSRRAGLVQRADEWARAASIRGQEYRESLGTLVRRWAFPVITAGAVLGSLAWAVAWQSIYSQPFSAVQSARWILQNVPAGSVLGQESWDETQPLGLVKGQLPPGQQRDYGGTSFGIYDDRPSPAEFDYIKGLLAQTDYIILNSNRMYRTIPKLPWRYPVQGRYYELLFQEKLGFTLVHTSQVSPSIFGITFDDQGADESYTVYDHPKILIFQKTSDLSDDELATLFGKAVEKPSLSVRHAANPYDKSLLLDQPVGQTMPLGDYNWNPIAQNQWVGLLLWLLVLEGFGLLAWPLVAVVCRRLPDRGYPLAKTVGLLVVAWLTWMAASAHLLPFTVWSIGAATVLLGLLSLAIWRRMAGELGSFVRDRAWLVLGWEAVFLVAFAFFTLIRMWNPDLWQPWQGGEKPMEFAFINGILRSPYMPPIDSFFAGGYINYYYYGQFMVAVLIKFVGLDSAVGFNLAIPTFFAMVCAGAACVVYNCVALVQRARGWRRPASLTAFGFGLIGAIMLGAMGNLAGAGLYIASAFPQVAAAVLPIFVKLNILSSNFTVSSGNYNYWAPRTVIGTLPPTQTTINEFPFWTFLFADLHPHLISMAFTILVAALALNLLLGAWRWPVLRATEQAALDTTATAPATPGSPLSGASAGSVWSHALVQLWGAGPLDAILRFGLTALALGSLAAINTWDFPTYAALLGIALVGAVILAWRAAGNRTITVRAALLVAVVVGAIVVTVAALVLYLPFFISFKNVAVSGGSPIRFIEINDPTRPWMRRTYISEFISFWGIFVFIAGSYLVLRLWHFPWAEAVADWGRWIGGVGRVGPQAAVPPPVPAPRPSVPEVSPPALPAEPGYSAALPSTNGHGAEEAAPEPAQPLPAFGFTAGFEPLDTGPGDAELAPGLHPATARHANTPPPADDAVDEYPLGDSGALGLALDDEEVRRHSTRRSLAPPPALHEDVNGYVGDAGGYDNEADAADAETTAPPRRAVPLDRPDGEPTYTMRVPPEAFAGTPDDESGAEADTAAAYTNDELTREAAPADTPPVLSEEPDPLEPHPLIALEGETALVASPPPGYAPAPVVDVALSDPMPSADEVATKATWQPADLSDPLESGALRRTPLAATPDDDSIHVIAASDAAPPLDETFAAAAAESADLSTLSNVVESPAEPLLTARDIAPPGGPLPPDSRQRGIMPAGIGLLLLGLTGVLVAGLLIKQEWLLALLTLLIGGLVATHLGSVRAPGTLFGGVLLVLGLGVAMAVEIVYLADFLAGGEPFRMNTVFKFYMQVWVLLAMGSAVALYSMLGPRGRLIRRAAPAAPAPETTAGLATGLVAASAPPAPPVPTGSDYTAFMPPEEAADLPAASGEQDDPLGWLVPPAPGNGVPAQAARPDATTPGMDLGPAGDADVEVTGIDAPSVETWPPEGDAPLAEPEPAGLDQPPDDGVVLVDPNADHAGELPVDTVVPPDAPADDDRPAADTRPGLGPGTYDPDDLTPPGQGDADEPLARPAVPPTWSDAEGAAIADAAEEQASLPADAGEPRLEGHEIVTHDAPVETEEPASAPVEQHADAGAAAPALPVRRAVRRPPVGRPSPAWTPPPADPVTPEAAAPPLPETAPEATAETAGLATVQEPPVPALPDEPAAGALAPEEPDVAAISPALDAPDLVAAPGEGPPDGSADELPEVPAWAAAAVEPPPTIGTESPWEGPAAESLPLASVEPPVAPAPAPPVLVAAPPDGVVMEELDAPASPFRLGVRVIWYLALGVLLLASFVFTVVGTQARVTDRFPDRSQWPPIGTLNGMDWMNAAQLQLCFNGNQTCGTIIYRFEREALDWLRAHVDGAPVVADDPHDYYRESGGMVATYTGLPILYGPQHEGEQRYDWQVSERSGDAEEFFRTDSVDRARILIAKYDIAYIYVGQVARISRRELPGAISKFDDMAQAGLLEVAFKNTAVTIYHVKQAAGQLGGAPGQPRPSPTPKPTPTEPPLGSDPKLVALEAAVQQNPTDAAARLELATYYRDHQNYSKAVEQYQEVLKLSPKDVATYQALGDTYQQMGDDAAALAAWEEAVRQVPDNPDAHNKVGIAYSARGRYDDAIREFQATVRINPKFVEASYHLGEVYEVLQQKDKAIQAYQAVIANGGDTDWVRQAQTRIDALK